MDFHEAEGPSSAVYSHEDSSFETDKPERPGVRSADVVDLYSEEEDEEEEEEEEEEEREYDEEAVRVRYAFKAKTLVRSARKESTRKDILRQFPFMRYRGEVVKGEARVFCSICISTMRFDRETVKTHATSRGHAKNFAKRKHQLDLTTAFQSIAPSEAVDTVVLQAAAVGMPRYQLQRFLTPSVFAALNSMRSPPTNHACRVSVEKLQAITREQFISHLEFRRLPYSLQQDDSNTRKADHITNVLLTNMEGTWLVKSLFLEDGKASTHVEATKTIMAEYGLSSNLLVATPSDNAASAFRTAKDLAQLSEIAIPVQCGAHGLNLVVKHFSKHLPLAVKLVEAVSGSLFAGGSLSMRRKRAKDVGLHPWKLHYASTRWFSKIEVAVEIADNLDRLKPFIDSEMRLQSGTVDPAEQDSRAEKVAKKLAASWGLLNNRLALIQLSILCSLRRLESVFTSLQGRYRNTCSPQHVTVLQTLYEQWKKIQSVPPASIRLATNGFAVCSIDQMTTQEKLTAKKLLWAAVDGGIAAYDDYVADTVALIKLINLFHPPYLVMIPQVDAEQFADMLGVEDHTPALEERARVISDLLGPVSQLAKLTDEFLAHQQIVRERCDPLLFGAGYWGIGSEGSRKWPLLAQVARRYLAIPPTVCAAESSFSNLTQLDTPHRQRISPDTLVWELFVAYNGGTPADWSRKRMLAGHREVTRKRAKTDGGTSRRRRL